MLLLELVCQSNIFNSFLKKKFYRKPLVFPGTIASKPPNLFSKLDAFNKQGTGVDRGSGGGGLFYLLGLLSISLVSINSFVKVFYLLGPSSSIFAISLDSIYDLVYEMG